MSESNNFHYKKAVILTCFSALSYAAMSLFVKLAAHEGSPTNMILFSRFLIGFICILFIIQLRKNHNPISLKTKYFRLHFFRSIAGLTAMTLLFYALRFLPLYNVSLLGTTYPLFVPILAALVMKIITPKKVWYGIIIGFIGITLILKPDTGMIQPLSLIALGGGFCIAIGVLLVRQLGKKEETYTIMFYYFGISLFFSFFMAIFDWHTPSLHAFFMLLGVSVFSTLFQKLNIDALKLAPARIVATVMYLNVIFSLIFGWFFFGHLPHIEDWIGIALVCFGAIYSIFHASQQDMMRKK